MPSTTTRLRNSTSKHHENVKVNHTESHQPMSSIFGQNFDNWTRCKRKQLVDMIVPKNGPLKEFYERFYDDNPFMTTCFRKMPNTVKGCIFSIFQWHNDTMNIWTHLCAGIFYSFFAFKSFYYDTQHRPFEDRIFWFFMWGVFVLAWSGSAFYHTFRCRNLNTFNCTLVCDLSGIVTAIGSFIFLVTTYELRCFPVQKDFWFLYTIALTILNIVAIPILMRLGLNSVRTALWIFYAATAMFVLFHLDSMGYETNWTRVTALFVTYFAAVSSLVVRNVKFPERFRPGTYDLIGASHQLFHIGVALSPLPLLFQYYSDFLAGKFDVPCEELKMKS